MVRKKTRPKANSHLKMVSFYNILAVCAVFLTVATAAPTPCMPKWNFKPGDPVCDPPYKRLDAADTAEISAK